MEAKRDENIDIEKTLDIARKASEDAKKPKSTVKATTVAATTSMDNYKHGDFYVAEGEPVGIVIDKTHRLEEIAKSDGTLNAVRDLGDQNDALFDKMDGDCHRSNLDHDPALEFIKSNPDSEAALKLIDVKKEFADYGMTMDGLAPKDDPRTKLYEEALAKVRSGEVVLPTVAEYDMQLKEREKRRNMEATVAPKKEEPVKVEEQPVEEEIKEEEFIKEEEEMSSATRQEIMESAAPDPLMGEALNPKKKEEEKAPIKEERKPIDLAALEDSFYAEPPKQETAPVKEEPKEPSVTIEVPESKADTFMENMPEDVKKKVVASNVVKVNFTRKMEIPKATKIISNIDSYRRIAPKNVSSELVARTLVNSGYIGYFKSCGSLEWSQLSPVVDEDGETSVDSGKVAEFCYAHLVTTSLGNISYRKFLEETSTDDVPAMLHAIMQASLPDEQSVVMVCGRRTCQKEFDATYRISELPNISDIPDDVKEFVRRISGAKDVIDDAVEVHNDAPVMLTMKYTAKNTDFIFKSRDLASVIDRSSVLDELIERYGESAAVICAYIHEVYIHIKDAEGKEVDCFKSNNPQVICEELLKLSSDELDDIKAILGEMPSLEPLKYSLKGDFECPHCHTKTHNPIQDIMSLVFQVALKVRYLV